jgi:hypothetical protein
MAIKSVKDTIDRDSFIAEARKNDPQPESIWSLDNLNKLSNDALIDRLEQVDNQSMLIKWRILWTLRQRFPSDKVFGQYLADLKNSATRYIIASSPQTITKSIQAGRFCERHKITSLEEVRLLPSSIYALSRPIYEDVSDSVFKQVKEKNLPNVEVERLLEQAKAVSTIEQQPQQPVEMDYERDFTELHFIQDTNNIATESDFIESIASHVERIDLQPEITEADSYAHIPESNHQRRMTILATLPPLDDEISNDEMIAEVRLLCGQFMSPVFKIIPLIKLFINQLSAEKRRK